MLAKQILYDYTELNISRLGMLKQVKITRKFHNHRSQIDFPSTLAILLVFFITIASKDGHYCGGCTCWRNTPYMSLLHKINEIGVIISYALISLKTCIPNGTANLLFWHTHLIPYSM